MAVEKLPPPGRLIVIGGASQCGKTTWLKTLIAKRVRVFAWDPEDQWAELPGWIRVTTRRELLNYVTRAGNFKVAYVAGGDLSAEFNFFAGCVMHSTRYTQPTDCIAEELSDVTTPSKAPGNWGILLRRGLKRGGNIYCISQRWQEADKTALGNASEFVLFRQNGPKAARYLADQTGIAPELIPKADYKFVRLDPKTGEVTHG